MRPDYRAPSPVSDWLVLVFVFLAAVLVLMAIDYPVGTWTLGTFLLMIPSRSLAGSWFVNESTKSPVREGYTGNFPWSPTSFG